MHTNCDHNWWPNHRVPAKKMTGHLFESHWWLFHSVHLPSSPQTVCESMMAIYRSKLLCVKPHHKLTLSSPYMPVSEVGERPQRKKRVTTVMNNPDATELLLVLCSDQWPCLKGQWQKEEGQTLATVGDNVHSHRLLYPITTEEYCLVSLVL